MNLPAAYTTAFQGRARAGETFNVYLGISALDRLYLLILASQFKHHSIGDEPFKLAAGSAVRAFSFGGDGNRSICIRRSDACLLGRQEN